MSLALIYDLDNTLFPTWSIPDESFVQIARKIVAHSPTTRNPAQFLSQVMNDLARHAPLTIYLKYNLPDPVRMVVEELYQDMPIPASLHPYEDIMEVTRIAGRRFLVTSGYQKVQRKKIAALGIEDWFEEVFIDSSGTEPTGKLDIFAALIQKHALAPDQVIVVGDNPASELAAGKLLGLTTVQVIRERGIGEDPIADFRIRSLTELHALIRNLQPAGSHHPLSNKGQ
jgi:FMN phosphatase YigB (HAD superfamily)